MLLRDRPKTPLNSNLEKNLSTYAVAAIAAGIGILALPQPSRAEIIYTPAHFVIPENGGPVSIDLNHDGLADFTFFNFFSQASPQPPLGFHEAALSVFPAQKANRVYFVSSQGKNTAAELTKGAAIERNSPFQPGYSHLIMAGSGGSAYSTFFVGPWLSQNQHQGFLGLRFTINGQNHFGWARLTIQGVNNATITGYAYEDVADTPIRAGRTSGADSLGTLAKGAAGRK